MENQIVKEYNKEIKIALEKINTSKTQLIDYSSRNFNEFNYKMMKKLMEEITENATIVNTLSKLANKILAKRG